VIVGVGIDLVAVGRLESTLAAWGERFERRVFTAGERAHCRAQRRPGLAFAARFAAKEAFSKAVGTGLAAGLRWTDVEVVRDPAGAPGLCLTGAARALAERRGADRLHVSLSHDRELAIAVVVLEAGARP
jgi:holo-[acyl-carrier protein] synthase